MTETGMGMLMTTLPSKNAAAKIARKLVGERLAACVQLCAIESFYRWQGETVNEPETLLLIKTRMALFDAAIARIKELHPYTVPEIVGTEFRAAGHPGYFAWIDESTTARRRRNRWRKSPLRIKAASSGKTGKSRTGQVRAACGPERVRDRAHPADERKKQPSYVCTRSSVTWMQHMITHHGNGAGSSRVRLAICRYRCQTKARRRAP